MPMFKFLVDLWNKIKQISLFSPSMEISETDVVVFVLGRTGSGKSWFAKTVTKSDSIEVGRGQHPCTIKVQAIRCELTDEAKVDGIKNIVFVDTPSFLTEHKHPDAPKAFEAWFNKTKYSPRYVGVIYMHDVKTNCEPIKNHLQEFSNIHRITNAPLPRPLPIRVVISYEKISGTIPESKITERASKLRTEVDSLRREFPGRWQLSMHQKQFEGEHKVAWEVVEELLKSW